MLLSVEEVASKLGVSKVTIYKKLKLKELSDLTVKKQGKTYIDDDLFNLISVKLNGNNEVESETDELEENIDISEDTDWLKEENNRLKEQLIEQMKNEIEHLRSQLKEKDIQLESKDKLMENMQVLVKQQQDKEIQQLQLEEHFEVVDKKLSDIRERMLNSKEEKKGFFSKIFN